MWKAFQDGQMGMEAGMSQTVGGRQDRARACCKGYVGT